MVSMRLVLTMVFLSRVLNAGTAALLKQTYPQHIQKCGSRKGTLYIISLFSPKT